MSNRLSLKERVRHRLSGVKSASYSAENPGDDVPLDEESRGVAEVEAHKPVIERETPHYFKAKDTKSKQTVTVKMTIRGITVLEDGSDNVIGHYNFRQIQDFHVGEKRENFYFTFDGANGKETHEFKTKDALNMIGTATAFVDKLVAQQRQASEKASNKPQLDYAHPENWTKEDVATWLKSKGLKEAFVKDFLSNDVDGAALSELDGEDLAGMGIKKEENQKKLLKSISKLFKEARPKTSVL